MIEHKEPWQNYYMNGEPVAEPQEYGGIIPTGQQTGVASIFIWRRNDGKLQILLQTRSPQKRVWPSYLDVSAAGHIDFGEQPMTAALRETEEEIGLKLNANDFIFIGTLPVVSTYPDPHEPELHFIYAFEAKTDLQLNFTDEEVVAADWYDVDEVLKFVHAGENSTHKIAKHDTPLFDFVVPAIAKF